MSGISMMIKNLKEVTKEVEDMKQKSEKAVSRTVGDFKSRGPSWISQEVAAEYNIKKKDVNAAKKGAKNTGSIKVKGVKVDNIELLYQGRLLTPTHFGMTPKVRPQKVYTVSAQIKKSSGKKVLSPHAFLAESGGTGTTQIPFQRRGQERYPIDVIKTLSIPQMITNEKVSKNITKRMNEEMGKRLQHNLKRLMK